MKIQIASDLHLEFHREGELLLDWTDADVIVLAGDIGSGASGVKWAGELSRERDVPVIYVPGNHEFYGQPLDRALQKMREVAREEDVYLLSEDVVIIEGVRFLGTTLWTDYSVDPATSQRKAMEVCGFYLNDHRRIFMADAAPPRSFSPDDAHALHLRARSWLEAELESDFAGRTVVVTHHGPAPACHHPKYPVGPISAAFYSDLTDLFDPVGVQLWMYGHTHANCDTEVNGVRLVSNQAGYPGERPPGGYDPAFLIDTDLLSPQE